MYIMHSLTLYSVIHCDTSLSLEEVTAYSGSLAPAPALAAPGWGLFWPCWASWRGPEEEMDGTLHILASPPLISWPPHPSYPGVPRPPQPSYPGLPGCPRHPTVFWLEFQISTNTKAQAFSWREGRSLIKQQT